MAAETTTRKRIYSSSNAFSCQLAKICQGGVEGGIGVVEISIGGRCGERETRRTKKENKKR